MTHNPAAFLNTLFVACFGDLFIQPSLPPPSRAYDDKAKLVVLAGTPRSPPNNYGCTLPYTVTVSFTNPDVQSGSPYNNNYVIYPSALAMPTRSEETIESKRFDAQDKHFLEQNQRKK